MTRPDGTMTAPGRACPEWATFCRVDSPQAEEWVHVAVIDQLLAWGVRPSDIRYEMWLGQSARCDVVVVTADDVLVIECKREQRLARSTARKQTRRYLEVARLRWPERDVRALLVWGTPIDPTDLYSEVIQ